MFEESLYFSAFIIGLLGSTHCAGMCGGIISGLTLGISKTNRRKYFFSYSLIYNLGRIISYAAAGAITAGMGNIADNYDFGIEIRKGFTLLAAITMIFIGNVFGTRPRKPVSINRFQNETRLNALYESKTRLNIFETRSKPVYKMNAFCETGFIRNVFICSK